VKCAGITSFVEGYCCRVIFREVRPALSIQTRRPKERPTHFPLRVNWPNNTLSVDLPISEFPAAFILPIFGMPGILKRVEPAPQWPGGRLVQVVRHLDKELLSQRYGSGWIDWTYNKKIKLGPFARMLAKIAHCACVTRLGYGTFSEYLPDQILGKDPNLGYLIGSETKIAPPEDHNRHDITVRQSKIDDRFIIWVTIRLFGRYETPTYIVVAGHSEKQLRFISDF